MSKSNYKLKYTYGEDYEIEKAVEHEFTTEDLATLLENVTEFIRASGYGYVGSLEGLSEDETIVGKQDLEELAQEADAYHELKEQLPQLKEDAKAAKQYRLAGVNELFHTQGLTLNLVLEKLEKYGLDVSLIGAIITELDEELHEQSN